MNKRSYSRVAHLNYLDSNFHGDLARLLLGPSQAGDDVREKVSWILASIKKGGDDALLKWTRELDDRKVETVADLKVKKADLDCAREQIPKILLSALEDASDRIRHFHEYQKADSWRYVDKLGNELGQRVAALDRIGIYVPGGQASYPSSVLMNAIPAKVAGVENIVMMVPAPRGEVDKVVLAAASIAGVDNIYTAGGAQAVGAMAYGTETIEAVDKIVGPGNLFVAEAKKQVFGRVGIDMLAGPSEIVIIADGSVSAEWITMDLFAQAEHDQYAQTLLISPDQNYLDEVAACIDSTLPRMARGEIIASSLSNRGALITVPDLACAAELSNQIAPEHLQLSIVEPKALLPQIRAAGAIFLGAMSSESLGDYCAGPNHVLPTSGTARFSSPLGVYDFQRRSSIISISKEGAKHLGSTASILADSESLEGHALSARMRFS